MRTLLPLLLACTALAGCVSLSRSETLSAEAASSARGLKVVEVRMNGDGLKVTPAFEGIFRERVSARLNSCAKGDRAVRLEATITRLDKANPVMTAVIGGANVIRGRARLVDAATGQTVGDYRIGATVVGGRLGVIKMAEAEEQLSEKFGDEVCAKVFGKR